MKLYDGGVYLVNGCDIVEEGKMEQPVSREDAAKEHYGIWYSGGTQYFWKYAEITDQV